MAILRSKTEEEPEGTKHDFTTRSIMSLVVEGNELAETTRRLTAVVNALALAYGISTKV